MTTHPRQDRSPMKCKRCRSDMETTAFRVTDEGTAQDFICRVCGCTTTTMETVHEPLPDTVFSQPEMTATCVFCGYLDGRYSKSNNVKALCCDVVIMREDIYKCPECKKTFTKRHKNAGFSLLSKLMAEISEPMQNHYQKEVHHG